MKKHFKFILAAMLITMGAISCSEDKFDNSSSNGEKVITLTGGYGDDSRLSFNNSEYKYYWNDGDEITLWNNDGESVNIQLTSGAGTKTGVFSGRVGESFNPAYITYAKGTGESANNGTQSVNLSRIDPIAFSSGLMSLPDLSYGTISVSSNGKYTFQLNHSVTFVYLKNVSVNGTAVSQVNVTTNTGSLSVDKNGALTPSDLSAVTTTVNVGTVIPVLPTNFSVTTTDNSTVIVPATNLAAGSFYTIDKDVAATKTLTFAASPTAGGSVSSDSQDVAIGKAASAVTATANTGYTFEGWYLGSVKLGASGTDANGNSYTVSNNVLTITDVQAAASYVAKFATAAPTYVFSINKRTTYVVSADGEDRKLIADQITSTKNGISQPWIIQELSLNSLSGVGADYASHDNTGGAIANFVSEAPNLYGATMTIAENTSTSARAIYVRLQQKESKNVIFLTIIQSASTAPATTTVSLTTGGPNDCRFSFSGLLSTHKYQIIFVGSSPSFELNPITFTQSAAGSSSWSRSGQTVGGVTRNTAVTSATSTSVTISNILSSSDGQLENYQKLWLNTAYSSILRQFTINDLTSGATYTTTPMPQSTTTTSSYSFTL